MIVTLVDQTGEGRWEIEMQPTTAAELAEGQPGEGALALILLEIARDLVKRALGGSGPSPTKILVPR